MALIKSTENSAEPVRSHLICCQWNNQQSVDPSPILTFLLCKNKCIKWMIYKHILSNNLLILNLYWCSLCCQRCQALITIYPKVFYEGIHWPLYLDSKLHGDNMGPTWDLPAPGGHVGPINFAIWVFKLSEDVLFLSVLAETIIK